jgi:hypothetical protein
MEKRTLLAIALLAVPMANVLAFRPSPMDRALHNGFEEAKIKAGSIAAQAKTGNALAELAVLKEQVNCMSTGDREAGLVELKKSVMEEIAKAEKAVSAQ